MFESIYNTENYNKYELNENLNLDIIENEDDRLKLKELLLKFNCKNFKELKESICFDIQTEI